jgi:ferredoxin
VLHVRIDLHRCIGAGTCIFVAPTAFRWQRNESKAEVLDPTTVEDEAIREAALACPTQAIIISDGDDSSS